MVRGVLECALYPTAPRSFLLLLFIVICVLRCFGGAVYCVVLRVVLCLWVRLIVFGTGYNIVSWVIVSMFLFVVGGLFVLFRQAYYLGTGGTMVMQQVEEMTLDQEMTLAEAISNLERLLEEFSFRSGGGDGDVIYGAIKALKYLKYLRNLQTVRQIQEVE